MTRRPADWLDLDEVPEERGLGWPSLAESEADGGPKAKSSEDFVAYIKSLQAGGASTTSEPEALTVATGEGQPLVVGSLRPSMSVESDPEAQRLVRERGEEGGEPSGEELVEVGEGPKEPVADSSLPFDLVERNATREGFWRHTIAELLFLFGIMVLVELQVGDGVVGAFGIHPHPYWLILLPVAAARGLAAALMAAGVATVLYGVGANHTVHVQSWLHLLDLKIMDTPVLFFGAAFVLGELRDLLSRRHADVWRRYEHEQEQALRIDHERRILKEANGELKRRVFDQSANFGTLMEAVQSLETALGDEIFDLVLDIVSEHCHAIKASVLLVLEDGTVDLVRHLGWEEATLGENLARNGKCAQVQRVIRQAMPYNGMAPHEVPPAEGPLLVAPVCDAGGVVTTLLCIDEIPITRVNEVTVTLLYSIAEWLGVALRRVDDEGNQQVDLEQAVSKVLQSVRWMGGARELGHRIRIDDSRGMRHSVPTAVIGITAPHCDPHNHEVLKETEEFLLTKVCPSMRLSDDIYRFGFAGCWLMVLTGTAAQGAPIVKQRLMARSAMLQRGRGEALEFEAFVPGAQAANLEGLMDPIAEWMRDCASRGLPQRTPVVVPGRNRVGNSVDCARRLRLEISIAKRFDLELQVLDYRGDKQKSGLANMMARHVEHVSALLRTTDGVFVLDEHRMAVILPKTSEADAALVAKRIADSLRATLPSDRVDHLETDCLALDTRQAEVLLEFFLGKQVQERTSEPTKGKVTQEPMLSEDELMELGLGAFGVGETAEPSAFGAEAESASEFAGDDDEQPMKSDGETDNMAKRQKQRVESDELDLENFNLDAVRQAAETLVESFEVAEEPGFQERRPERAPEPEVDTRPRKVADEVLGGYTERLDTPQETTHYHDTIAGAGNTVGAHDAYRESTGVHAASAQATSRQDAASTAASMDPDNVGFTVPREVMQKRFSEMERGSEPLPEEEVVNEAQEQAEEPQVQAAPPVSNACAPGTQLWSQMFSQFGTVMHRMEELEHENARLRAELDKASKLLELRKQFRPLLRFLTSDDALD